MDVYGWLGWVADLSAAVSVGFAPSCVDQLGSVVGSFRLWEPTLCVAGGLSVEDAGFYDLHAVAAVDGEPEVAGVGWRTEGCGLHGMRALVDVYGWRGWVVS